MTGAWERFYLWDMDSGNKLGHFDRLEDAIEFVGKAVEEWGSLVVEDWEILGVTGREASRSVLHGEELARIASDRRRTMAAGLVTINPRPRFPANELPCDCRSVSYYDSKVVYCPRHS